MEQFVKGQRWISDAEPELGLGIVADTDFRQVHIQFLASEVRRSYAKSAAPLTRVQFKEGDEISTRSGEHLQVLDLEEHEGLIAYIALPETEDTPKVVIEIDLADNLQFKQAKDRLFSNQFDKPHWFSLRKHALNALHNYQTSSYQGLLGARISLLPHQIYVANKATHLPAPRVLLADEVGLGKTIEAGLILHYELVTGRAGRALVIVPEVLLHQWLVEMIRRFNLHFSLLDKERYAAITDDNPFSSEQLVLCSQEFLLSGDNPQVFQQACQAGWDMLIVDEAHHVEWPESSVSPAYKALDILAQQTPGLLLLTATPEQLGVASHFARLRLIDPQRFSDLEAFSQEEAKYPTLSQDLTPLLENQHLTEEDLSSLKAWLDPEQITLLSTPIDDPDDRHTCYQEILQNLVDRHGTSRVVFRNTRQQIKGFPNRTVHYYPLDAVDKYFDTDDIYPEASLQKSDSPSKSKHTSGLESLDDLDFLDIDLDDLDNLDRIGQSSPSKSNRPRIDWRSIDPRINWLKELLLSLGKEKVLLICARDQTAIELADHLKQAGLSIAVFHSQLDLIDRDRAAAYFSQEEDGAQALICSEIGGEGRNFQFAHHLVLFDLPMNPDLVEQRIGRLDRIGQQHPIDIHIPGISGTASEKLFDWFHSGLNLFESINSAANSVSSQLGSQLDDLLFTRLDSEEWQTFIKDTQQLNATAQQRLHDGRDRLLELSSCNADEAHNLVKGIKEFEEQNPLRKLMERFFDCYGIDSQEQDNKCYILKPGDHMLISHLPGLPDDGLTFTYDRETALQREDVQFFSWEHPLVSHALELITTQEHGNSSIATIKHSGLPQGMMLVRSIYAPESTAPAALQLSRFLPATCIEVTVDNDGQELPSKLPEKTKFVRLDHNTAIQVLKQQQNTINQCLQVTEGVASENLKQQVSDAMQAMLQSMTGEIKRLSALQELNPIIKDEDIDRLKEQTRTLHQHISESRLRLDAIQILIAM